MWFSALFAATVAVCSAVSALVMVAPEAPGEACRIVMSMLRRCRRRKPPPVIWIEESPAPTKSPKTPLSRSAARRAGKKRLPSHRMRATKWYDPAAAGHCGYMCALRSQGRAAGKMSTMALRSKVAGVVTSMFIKDESIYGIPARQVINASGLTLAAYEAQTSHLMWASALELAVALREIAGKNTVYLSSRGKILKIYQGTGGVPTIIRLKDQHYTLYRCNNGRKDPFVSVPYEDYLRGGMMSGRSSRSRSRSVSPTLPWRDPAVSSRLPPSPLPSNEEDGTYPTPPSPDQPTPDRFPRNADSRSPECPAASTSPHSPPPAQHELTPRRIFFADGNYTWWRANPHALARKVIAKISLEKDLGSILRMRPAEAVLWQDVDYLELDQEVILPQEQEWTIDVRENGWEKHKQVRTFPAYRDDDLEMYIAAPYAVDVDEVIDRVYEYIGEDIVKIEVLPGGSWWLILQPRQHHVIREVGRGGMQHAPQQTSSSDHCTFRDEPLPHVDCWNPLTDVGESQLVWLDIPATPQRTVAMRFPIDASMQRCVASAADRFAVAHDTVSLAGAIPSSLLGGGTSARVPPTSACLMRRYFYAWSDFPTGWTETHYPASTKVGQMVSDICAKAAITVPIEVRSDGYIISHEMLLKDMPAPFAILHLPTEVILQERQGRPTQGSDQSISALVTPSSSSTDVEVSQQEETAYQEEHDTHQDTSQIDAIAAADELRLADQRVRQQIIEAPLPKRRPPPPPHRDWVLRRQLSRQQQDQRSMHNEEQITQQSRNLPVASAPVVLFPGHQDEDQSPRGGAKSTRSEQAAQRSTMIGWAEQRIEEVGLQVDMRTVRTILKAEQKIVSSILHASSQAQVAFVVAAAYRRIGLGAQAAELERIAVKPAQRKEAVQSQARSPDTNGASGAEHSPEAAAQQVPLPQEGQTQQPLHADLVHLVPTLAVLSQQMQYHTQSLGALGQACQEMAIRCDSTMDSSRSAIDVVSQRLEQLSDRMSSLEDRFGIWETTYLRTILEHLPPPAQEPIQSPSATRSPSHPYAKPITPSSEPPKSLALVVPSPATPEEMLAAHREQQQIPPSMPVDEVAMQVPAEMQGPQANTIQLLEQRSLRACAEKVVSQGKRSAIQPFKAGR